MPSAISELPAVRKIPARHFDDWEKTAKNLHCQFSGVFIQKLRQDVSGVVITAILQDGSHSQDKLEQVCSFIKTLPDHGIIVICERG